MKAQFQKIVLRMICWRHAN